MSIRVGTIRSALGALLLVVLTVSCAETGTVTTDGASQGPGDEVPKQADPEAPQSSPSSYVVLQSDGSVVRHVGDENRSLMQPADLRSELTGDHADDSSIVEIERGRTADEFAVVIASADEPCTATIRWLSEAGVLSGPVVQGNSPAVSPDSTMLAYVQPRPVTPEGPDCFGADLVVRDLESGAERRWSATELEGDTVNRLAIMSSLEWSPESNKLAFGTYDGNLNILDTEAEAESISSARRMRNERPGLQYPFWSVTSGDLYVVDIAGGPGNRTTPVVAIDAATGEPTRTIVDEVGEGRSVVALGGSSVLYAVGPPQPSSDEGRSLFALLDGRWQRQLSSGVVDVVP